MSSAIQSGKLLWEIMRAWVLVGTLDILAAIIQTVVAGASIERLMRYIASGAFGEAAFTGGAWYAIVGLVFHYLIAFTWTVLFFVLYPKLRLTTSNRMVVGIGYGAVIWFVMNRIVLPLSNVPQRPFDLQRAIIAAFVLMVAIGIPLSFRAQKYFSGTSAGGENG
ncbi:MAG: hypothetical protein JNL40_03810 [Cyclobacteriaceae bacterium]|nr:hypothetical protein [Cyclobacteriaceae bacterium]